MEYTWSVLPAKENILKSLLGIAIIAFVAMVVHITFDSTAWAGFSVIVLVVSLQRYFFTSFFRIDEKGINASYLIGKKFLPWGRIKTFSPGRTNAYLSPMSKVSRWTMNRGLFIVYREEEKDRIEKIILDRMKEYGTG